MPAEPHNKNLHSKNLHSEQPHRESPHHEHEAKFEVSAAHLASLLSPANLLDGYTSKNIGILSQIDTYMDTPSFELLRHGLALRIRHNGTAYEAGIKSIQSTRKGAIQERMDVTIPLPAEAKPFDATTWPDSVQEQFANFSIKQDEIRPILVVRQERRKAHLSPLNGPRVIAEWSLDDVWIGAPLQKAESLEADETEMPQKGAQGNQADFHELEIEWLAPESAGAPPDDDDDAFTALVAQVQRRYELRPVYQSKMIRGLEKALALAHDNRSEITAEMELEAAVRLLLHQQLFQINLNEHGVRYSQNAKYVHDMRVAVRRARAAMQLFRQTISAKRLKPYEKGLKLLGRALGAVRDLDVAIANLRTFGRSLPKGQRQALKRARTTLTSRREHAHTDLVAILDSKKHRKFVIEFDEFCITPSSDVRNSDASPYEILPSQVRHTVPSLILHAFEAVRCYESAFSGDKLPPLETFHALRIEAKYLRYLLEFTEHLLGRDGGALIAQLQGLQEHLGELNDAGVEQDRFHEWGGNMKKDGELRKAVETRLAQSAKRIAELSAATPARLDKFVSPTTRRKLANALASI